MTTEELTALADRLEAYNAWRRDGYDTSKMKYDPEPFRIGLDIDEAVKVIRLAAIQA